MFNIWVLTSFKTENFCNKFFDIKTYEDLQDFLDNLLKLKFKKSFVFWGGTNLLLKERYYEDIIFVRFLRRWIKYLWNNFWKVSGWESLSYFIRFLNKYWINTLNPLFWLPWTIAGAVIWNAWSFWVEIGQFVESIKILDFASKKIKTFLKKDYKYSYRWSNLKKLNDFIVLEVIFKIDNLNDKDIKSPDFYVRRRLENQPHWKTCWSYFKNIKLSKFSDNVKDFLIGKIKSKLKKQDVDKFENFVKKQIIPAGWLIEKASLKWYDFGGVKISEKHANFFINYNNLDWKKIYDLGLFVKEKVYDVFWIELEEEVIIV